MAYVRWWFSFGDCHNFDCLFIHKRNAWHQRFQIEITAKHLFLSKWQWQEYLLDIFRIDLKYYCILSCSPLRQQFSTWETWVCICNVHLAQTTKQTHISLLRIEVLEIVFVWMCVGSVKTAPKTASIRNSNKTKAITKHICISTIYIRTHWTNISTHFTHTLAWECTIGNASSFKQQKI